MSVRHGYENILAFIFLALSFVAIIIHYHSRSDIVNYFFLSDSLYLPTLFEDIFANGGKINDWYLTPSPYFFPDYPAFFFAYLIGNSPQSQMIAFALIQASLVLVAVFLISKETTKKSSSNFTIATTILIILIWFALSAGEPFVFILLSTYHYGAFLSAILLIALWLKYHENDSGSIKSQYFILTLIGVFTFSTTLSDNLFLVQFVAPLIATHLLISILDREFSFKKTLKLFFIALCSLLGSISYNWTIANQTRYPTRIGIDNLSQNLKGTYELFYAAVVGNSVFGIIFLLYLGVVLHSFILLLRGDKEHYKLSWLAIFSFLSLCATLSITLVVTNLQITGRYLIPTFSWPIIVVLIFINNRFRDRFALITMLISILALSAMSWSSYKLIQSNGIKEKYYPGDMACIDDILEKENVRNGIAQYWDAKHIQNLSRLKLNIAQHFEDLSEMHWITSKKYFKPTYDFAIITEAAHPPFKLSLEALTRLNGKPKLIKACGSRTVYVYGKDQMRVRNFVNVGDNYTWKACDLPTVIGEQTAECEMQKMDNAQSGYLTFGPYEQLSTGEYTFSIAYSSNASKGEPVGNWDALLAIPQGSIVMQDGLITGTNGAIETIIGQFKVSPEQNMGKIEIRTTVKKDVDLKIIYIRIDLVH